MTGNYVYRRFCRIDGGDVPDSKSMVRYGQLLDGDILKAIFDRVVEVARVRGVSKGRRLRVDTTVVEAPIHYPTDSSLCADSVRVLSREMKTAEDAGAKLPFVRTDVRRSLARRALEIGYARRKRGYSGREVIILEPVRFGLCLIVGNAEDSEALWLRTVVSAEIIGENFDVFVAPRPVIRIPIDFDGKLGPVFDAIHGEFLETFTLEVNEFNDRRFKTGIGFLTG